MPRFKIYKKKTTAIFYLFSTLLIGSLLLSACGKGGGNTPDPTIISNGTWSKVAGSGEVNVPATYGTKGVPAPGNAPGARQFAVSSIDANGNLWLFGGRGVASDGLGYLNDLWKFDGTNWTWVSGSDTINAAGTYGAIGTAAPGNVPGARESAVSWTDASGNFWLFGGIESTGGVKGRLNDLWKFDGTNWTWMAGSEFINIEGAFDALGTAVPGTPPGARFGASSWTDKNNNLWLFGGFGPMNGVSVHLNDLWKFDGTNWTWVMGNAFTAAGNYSPAPNAAPAGYFPGARREAVSWTDANGTLWLFGGFGLANGGIGFLNDLWKFDGTNWTWAAGSNGINGLALYGTPMVAEPANIPGARGAGAAWTDAGGTMWLFGGLGLANSGTGLLNDLWKFDGTNWTWVSGSNGINLGDSDGTQGIPPSPGGREGAAPWADASGNLWLFGGSGPAGGPHNDLWRYQP